MANISIDRLKSKAKSLVKTTGVKHRQALEQLARSHGFDSYHALTESEAARRANRSASRQHKVLLTVVDRDSDFDHLALQKTCEFTVSVDPASLIGTAERANNAGFLFISENHVAVLAKSGNFREMLFANASALQFLIETGLRFKDWQGALPALLEDIPWVPEVSLWESPSTNQEIAGLIDPDKGAFNDEEDRERLQYWEKESDVYLRGTQWKGLSFDKADVWFVAKRQDADLLQEILTKLDRLATVDNTDGYKVYSTTGKAWFPRDQFDVKT